MPRAEERESNLRSVLHVLYLIFNEGYTSSAGEEFQRAGLASESIRLTRLVQARLPEHAEVCGLPALQLPTDARSARIARET